MKSWEGQNKMVRVRFAPSPTGYLHIGGARTALFNWLFARHNKGVFILRIEDTDILRTDESSLESILEDLKWLGLDWDEGPNTEGNFGPYFQSQRQEIYPKYIKILFEKGYAYYCYCTPFELEQRRNLALSEHKTPGYDGRCRNLGSEEKKKYEAEGRRPAVRFKIPDEGKTEFRDLIRGEVVFDNKLLDDFVILKSGVSAVNSGRGGLPTYNFANVIDDALMEITHVIRGDEHISNTPRQILLYRALGFKEPVYVHIPLILGKDGSPLSKRHGTVSVGWYREQGFLPEALVNYLVLLGWAPDGIRQILRVEDMIKEFIIERVSKNPAIFDIDKLTWINSEYLKNMDPDKKTDLVIEYLVSSGAICSAPMSDVISDSVSEASELHRGAEKDKIKEIVNIIGDRLKIISDIETYGSFFFTDEIKYDETELSSKLSDEKVRKGLAVLKEKFASIMFDHQNIEQTVRDVARELGLKAKDIIHPLRYVLTGKTVGPSLFESIALLGREKTIARLKIGTDTIF